MNKVWPTLFKTNSDGSMQQWTISAHRDTDDLAFIGKVYGKVGGKLVTTAPDYILGKNIGKSNETSPWDQACLEAEAQWKKKQTGAKGYTPSKEDAAAGTRSELNSGAPAPMLAKTYGKVANGVFEGKDNGKIEFPCLGQAKLNGNRLIASITDGVATLTSRDCKPIDTVPHIKAALEALYPWKNGKTLILDGEMYNHELYEHLEDLRHMIAHGDERVQYHIYDIVEPGLPQLDRSDELYEMFAGTPCKHLRMVETFDVNDHEHALTLFQELRDTQYEGLILRNTSGYYGVGKRSYDLQKLKGWIDREFLIVDVVEKGRGKDAGKAKFVCVTGDGDPIPGVEFKMDIAASQEIRAELWEKRDELVGKWLSVRFSYYTQEGKPFHGNGQEIREASESNNA